jgi:hypothetical protein
MAGAERQNVKEAKVDWRFTTTDARIRLKKIREVHPDMDLELVRLVHIMLNWFGPDI